MDDPTRMINIQSNTTRNHYQESASMTAVHILVCLTQDDKSIEQIVKEDFDNNMELVTVWTDYMIAVNWMYKNTTNRGKKWIAEENGKKWIEKYYSIKDE
jgi:hypothetical protein